jgi:FtsH-binding integral membrane protein
MMLIGIILATIVNIFLNNTTFDLIISIIAIVVFIGYIAYDIQKVKNNVYGIDDDRKLAIMGALELYLDFINLFIHLLQIFGDRN